MLRSLVRSAASRLAAGAPLLRPPTPALHTPPPAPLLRRPLSSPSGPSTPASTPPARPPRAGAAPEPAAAEEAAALEFLAARGRALGLHLSLSERKLIAAEASRNGRLSPSDWERLVSGRWLADQERLTLSDYLAKSHDVHLGQHLLRWTMRLGIGFFALTGAHTAGEAGMHVLGATLTGCVTALGGGTLNNLVTGAVPVGWVRDPSMIAITAAAGLAGFYLWPLLERFLDPPPADASAAAGPSVVRYSLESVALGSLAVVGAQHGIVRGLHPAVCAVLGVTVAFGGVLRDLMCRRDLALGAATGCQSYGLASFAGAAVYVALREVHVWNCAGSTSRLVHGGIPIGLRILLGFGTVFGVRWLAWRNQPDGILLGMEDAAAANHARVLTLLFGPPPPKGSD